MTDTTDPVERLRVSIRELKQAEADVSEAAKDSVRAGLREAFENPDIQNVVFGVSTAPHNDENFGQGVFGPLVNHFDVDTDLGDLDQYELEQALFYDYGVKTGDSRVRTLSAALATADWKYIGAALGVRYYESEGHGSTSAFIAERKSSGVGYTFHEQSIDY
jgi:hypothetical protein